MRVYVIGFVLAACASHPVIRSDPRDEPPKEGEKGGTRLKVRYFVGGDGSEQAIGFFDTVRRENCTFAVAADGVVRCLPDVAARFSTFGHSYADAACTQELSVVASGCPVKYTTKAVAQPNACGPGGTRIFPLGAKVTGQVYEDDPLGGSQCRRGTLSPRSDYYVMGAEIPPSTFQNATEVVR